jgi:hypothetical protein
MFLGRAAVEHKRQWCCGVKAIEPARNRGGCVFNGQIVCHGKKAASKVSCWPPLERRLNVNQ